MFLTIFCSDFETYNVLCTVFLSGLFLNLISRKRLRKGNSRGTLQFNFLMQSSGIYPYASNELPPPMGTPRKYHGKLQQPGDSEKKGHCVGLSQASLSFLQWGEEFYRLWNVLHSGTPAPDHCWSCLVLVTQCPLNLLALWVCCRCKSL